MPLPVLQLESFRAFRDRAELELRPLTLLYGRNQVGKSTLLRLLPLRRLALTVKYQHRFLDDGRSNYDDKMRQDSSLWLVMNWWATDSLRLRVRLRYLNEALDAGDYLEQSLWAYLEGLWKLDRTLRVKLRYEIYAWLDDRTSTRERNPNPAHWLRLELEARF